MQKKTVGAIAATAVIGLMGTGTLVAGPKLVKGHYCQNNSCKGKSACGGMGNKNGCAGQNTCKGKGWLNHDTKQACEADGGKWAKAATKKKKRTQEEK